MDSQAPAPSPSTASAAPAREVAERFYDAFVNRRFDEMEALYAEGVRFRDNIFRFPDRAGTMRMWRKLLRDPDNVKASYRFERLDGNVAVGRWQADYEIFGRKVHNDIESRLTIEGGRIVDHRDTFDLGKWARQALPLGPLVWVPGVKPLLATLLRRVAR